MSSRLARFLGAHPPDENNPPRAAKPRNPYKMLRDMPRAARRETALAALSGAEQGSTFRELAGGGRKLDSPLTADYPHVAHDSQLKYCALCVSPLPLRRGVSFVSAFLGGTTPLNRPLSSVGERGGGQRPSPMLA